MEAAIGDGQAAEFSDDDMKKRNDKIAAAIALRGMAKDGKFSAAEAGDAAKEAVKGAGKEITLEKGSKAGADTNKAAGKLFGTAGGASAADARKGAAAVTAASGQQILSAIVEAADTANGKGAGQAKNAVEAAIGAGDAAEFSEADFEKRNDKIAAAIALRGMAKDGKFSAQGDGAKEAAKGAGKAITLEKGNKEGADTNKDAGKLFAANAAGGNGASADDARKGAAAVTAASGQQILSAIVEAASSTEGKKADEATNAVEAAIGDANQAGAAAEFGNDFEKR
ncbi:variable large family protein, partial [Borreliella burgdorferi]|uniref:variable large family protein n=1 Tax=Borreliella burgdorferi TaxID=139 RepID=UPI001E5DF8A7|nr:variable large family protein [Borreliella burgdorferi]